MIKSSIEKLAHEIGFDIGASDDITQGRLLSGFCKGLHDSIKDEYGFDLQIAYIVDKLDKKSIKTLKTIVEFIKIKEDEN
jgi:hypothetical protein